MTSAEIIRAIRRAIREPTPRTISDDEISSVVTRGVVSLGHTILEVAPSRYNSRKSLQAAGNTYAFQKPSDCMSILKVWDLGDTAQSITAIANNGGAIQLTVTAHGLDDDQVVFVHDVGGTTEANGTWKITVVDDDNLTLNGSTYTNAYTSGGKVFAEPSAMDEITLKPLADADLSSPFRWYPRADYIIVDDETFENDIVIDYVKRPSEITDIPSEWHDWLVSYGVDDLMILPSPTTDPGYSDKAQTLGRHRNRMSKIELAIRRTMKESREPKYIRSTMKDKM